MHRESRVRPLDEVDQTLRKSMAVLEAVAHAGAPCGVTELSEKLGLTKSNTHRILRGLVVLGYLRPSIERGRYELTVKLWELGNRFFSGLDLPRLCEPVMARIAGETRETVLVSVLDGREVVFVATTESALVIRAHAAPGQRAPADTIASGVVQLAWAEAPVLDEVRGNLVRYTAATITDPEAFDARLRRVREAGYAITLGEWLENASAVGAPIRDAHGRVVAGIAIAGPADRLTRADCERFSALLIEASAEISRSLGHGGHPGRGPRSKQL